MQSIDGRLVLSPTDLTKHQECSHLTFLDLESASGRLAVPDDEPDEALALIFRLGTAHEARYLESLRADDRSIREISTAFDEPGRRSAEAETLAAMRAGFDVIYQATFFDGAWGGQADFLLRVPEPSDLGPWSYEIADTKLARRMKVAALLQMATYADRLTVLQGRAPRRVCVVTGDGVERPWSLVDIAAYTSIARRRLETFVASPSATGPLPVPHCGQCRWSVRCDNELRGRDDLSLVAGMRRDHRDSLRQVGIMTLEQLATAGADKIAAPGIGAAAGTRLAEQAREQLAERITGRPSFTLLPPALGMGLLRLPPPSRGDVYLDFEGDPYAESGEGREYLAGLGDASGDFVPIWAHDRAAERQLVMDLVGRLINGWQAHPEMHVYHYAAYEVTALKRLTARYGVCEAELDQLLRAERFVDLYPVVRQSMRISKDSYSIKKVEAFYGRRHSGAVADAMASVLTYEKWLVDGDDDALARIAAYNKDDVDSTRELHDWLEERRQELEILHGPQPRPERPKVSTPTPRSQQEADELALVDRLRAARHDLLADLVQWHRREARPGWWEFFSRRDLEDDELIEDRSALGGLEGPLDIGSEKRSRLYEYSFPAQDCTLRIGKRAYNVDTRADLGVVFALDKVAGRVVLKRQAAPPTVRGLMGEKPIPDDDLRAAVAATARDVLAGVESLGAGLLSRRVPEGTRQQAGESPVDALLRVGVQIDGEVLAVQGPPGSGKTRAGAELIRRLLDAGKTVGVTATSHAVIGHLLREVGRPGIQFCRADQHCAGTAAPWSKDGLAVVSSLRDGSATLVGGTPWFWTRPDAEDVVDVLVIEEAGQFSLANAVAVSRAGGSLALLGDPQQLAQPSAATHPGRSGISVLEHMLDGSITIPADRGIFLDQTYRMHPRLTEFVSDLMYEGRLRSAPGRERLQILDGGQVAGSGLVLRPVVHSVSSRASSTEEADVISGIWHSLQGVPWADHEGVERPLGPADVLVVAPYNNQVALIADRVPAARVGTVDKFQGQEGPVVIYSLTSSSADDAPRGTTFLYDLHRLNVAVSRAKALAVVVLNPALLDAPARSPEELRRINALCRLAEMAGETR